MATSTKTTTKSKTKRNDKTANLRKALGKQKKDDLVCVIAELANPAETGTLKKDDLIDIIVEVAKNDATILRQLEERFNLEVPNNRLVQSIRRDIEAVTGFDTRETNNIGRVDHEAFVSIKKKLGRLVRLGKLRFAMNLAVLLMKRASDKIAKGNEGMVDDVEACLRVVIAAVKRSTMGMEEAHYWCNSMSKSDYTGNLCHDDLGKLRVTYLYRLMR